MLLSTWHVAVLASIPQSLANPSYSSASFTFPQSVSTRYATSVSPKPLTRYALPYASVSSEFKNVTTTTWPNWTPAAATPTVQPTRSHYDAAAFSNLWNALSPVNFTRGLYSTTVAPTPVPSSELILPPALLFSNPLGPGQRRNNSRTFPADFILGAAGSSFQCEGAVADQGKSPSALDALYSLIVQAGSALGSSIGSGIGGDTSGAATASLSPGYTTNEHYYLYKQDITRFAAIGLKQYSFSIPMSRIVPFALPGTPVNAEALQHYSDVVDFILSKGMEPIITLFHWETPLQFYGGGSFQQYAETIETAISNSTYGVEPIFTFGFQNSTFEESYVNYAKIVMSHLGDRVPKWVTFNEPVIGATNGAAVNTVLNAHSRVVHYYREVLKGKGKISMKMGVSPGLPMDATNKADIEAATTYTDLYIGAFLQPLVLGKDYPEAFKIAVPDHVPLTEKQLAYMKNTMDYISVDVYSPNQVSPIAVPFEECARNLSPNNTERAYPICLNISTITATGWAQGWGSGGASATITGNTLRTQLRYLYETYRKPVMISETGFSTPVPSTLAQNLYNLPQSLFLLNELDQILAAIHDDNVEVLGMLVWTWGDDLEFLSFDGGLGLQYINHTTQQRLYRRSFFDIIDFVESQRSAR